MEFLTVLTVIYNDETPTKKSIYTANSADEAVKLVHQNMSTYMTQSNIKSVMAMAINSIGGVYKNEHWVAPEPDVEAE